ncbi:ectonucleoside triphosphate diphosphohydrolase 6 isoform X2 [Thalassophryne amazonica]|uniref:ectonucleoside triphosphate diphosphohydrolase 6 isoform X2 n=1 Tax=Thalassophryne amazonica TaxID=390379 RepID=UPI00147099A1|nr:ectonucleoside triphosphate diphosphohydrolase 6 isoform X2 [Thalassophryne amazonica]
MKKPKLVGVLVLVGCLVTYLMVVKHHYTTLKPDTHRLPPYRPPALMNHSFRYGIMFDAGSTGTRVHIFKFQMGHDEAPKLVQETFRAIKPGLSAYADDPDQCKSGIVELLEVAKGSVPQSVWSSTPVVLKATAGLRLLPGEKAQHLMDQVRSLFLVSPFLSREDSVSIMDGTDEGISAWITVNFLTGGLHSANSNTVGVLDLGGGSTQITFSPQDEKTIQVSPVDYIRSFQMFNSTHTVYTHSYLGLGLMSARLAVLGGVHVPSQGSTELISPCLAPGYSGSWEHADVVYTVKGQKEGQSAYEACRSRVQKVLHGEVLKVPEAAAGEFYAFSFYYDRAVDLGVIDEKEGGSIKVDDYISAAKRVCGRLSVTPPQSPFFCLDLVYISVLLQDLGFPGNKQFKLVRTIDQVETSWALGATFHYIDSLKS